MKIFPCPTREAYKLGKAFKARGSNPPLQRVICTTKMTMLLELARDFPIPEVLPL